MQHHTQFDFLMYMVRSMYISYLHAKFDANTMHSFSGIK